MMNETDNMRINANQEADQGLETFLHGGDGQWVYDENWENGDTPQNVAENYWAIWLECLRDTDKSGWIVSDADLRLTIEDMVSVLERWYEEWNETDSEKE